MSVLNHAAHETQRPLSFFLSFNHPPSPFWARGRGGKGWEAMSVSLGCGLRAVDMDMAMRMGHDGNGGDREDNDWGGFAFCVLQYFPFVSVSWV